MQTYKNIKRSNNIMKEGYTIMKDFKGNEHEAPIIKAPYLKNLLNKQIEVALG